MYKKETTYLITTSAFFFGPDGQQYRAVWGYVKLHQAKDILGFEPTRQFANWYMEIGFKGTSVFIAGCQINYSVECPDRPFISKETFRDDKGMICNANSILIPGEKVD